MDYILDKLCESDYNDKENSMHIRIPHVTVDNRGSRQKGTVKIHLVYKFILKNIFRRA